ncbi:MAG: alpha/beta hydrolase [Actinomycetota bacterium]|nr:alpha/beta hydrolase [Actinomycetota bacterium]
MSSPEDGGKSVRLGRVDPQVRDLLKLLAGSGLQQLAELTPREAREQIDRFAQDLPPCDELARREDLTIAGPESQLALRVLTPKGPGPFPILLFLHGGGWVTGGLDAAEGAARSLAVGAGCVAVCADYRLAPEHPFPAALDDVRAVLRWIEGRREKLHGDDRAPAIAGVSAGANLAAGAVLRARDRGEPLPACQVLMCPVTDREFESPSMRDNGEGLLLERGDLGWCWGHYLSAEEDAESPYACPLRAADLSRLPPTLVITGELDPLRDQGEAFARRLRDAGVAARAHRYPGMIHGFVEFPQALDAAGAALDEAVAELRSAWAPTLAPG